MKRKKTGECTARLKCSVSVFVDLIFKMQRLEVSCAVKLLYTSLGAKGLSDTTQYLVARVTWRKGLVHPRLKLQLAVKILITAFLMDNRTV